MSGALNARRAETTSTGAARCRSQSFRDDHARAAAAGARVDAGRRFKSALLAREVPVSHGGVVGQVWRGRGSRQALLAKALASVDVRGLDEPLGRKSGDLLARARATDVVDAALVLLAEDGDRIVASDPEDFENLAAASGRHVEIVRA